MFKCLCGGGSNVSHNNTPITNNHNKVNNHNKHTAATNNIHSLKTIKNTHPNGTELGHPASPKSNSKSHSNKKTNNTANANPNTNTLNPSNPSLNSEAGTRGTRTATNIKPKRSMKKIRSVSGATTPSPANHYTNTVNVTVPQNNGNIMSPHNNIISFVPKHSRKKTHPYKSRGDPHSHPHTNNIPTNKAGEASASALSSPLSLDKNDYFILDNFQFSIQAFDFHLHYKFLIELAIKCLNIGPDVLSPSIFLAHNEIKCVVAILHENKHKAVPVSYSLNTTNLKTNTHKNKPLLHSYRSEKSEIFLNNVIGFSVCYPHSNCRPYPDSVWMIGWLCCDTHRMKHIPSQYQVLEALLRASHIKINPNSKTNYLPQIDVNGLHKYLKLNKLTIQNIQDSKNNAIQIQSPSVSSSIPNFVKNKNKKKAPRDKGIGIYAPYYHKKAQLLYESLGFEKIAKIGNYYSTDRQFFELFYAHQDAKQNEETNNAKKLHNNDAYLYCRGDLAHCRLLLGMEYFNYKKWPKKHNKTEAELDRKTSDENLKDSKAKILIAKNSKGKKRTHGPKILEEYLQSRIADYHAKQKELLLRNKMSHKSSPAINSKPSPNTANNAKHAVSHHASHHNIHNIRHHQQTHNSTHRSSHPYNTHSGHAMHPQHTQPNSNHQYGAQPQPQSHVHRSQSNYTDKRIRFSSGTANTHNNVPKYAFDEPPVPEPVPQPQPVVYDHNHNHHTPNGKLSDGKSRHSSIANSQVHYGSGYYGHYGAPRSHGAHSAHNGPGPSRHRSSVTPTPTYEHSNAVYFPHLSNASTATYTGTDVSDVNMGNVGVGGVGGALGVGGRGNSFYSMPSSHHSNASLHSHHSNVSMHSDPYLQQTGYHNQHHGHPHGQRHHSINNYLPNRNSGKYIPQKYEKYEKYEEMHGDGGRGRGYNAHNSHNRHVNHHNSHISDEVYNNNNHHKSRNKRYRQSSRHSHKKVQ